MQLSITEETLRDHQQRHLRTGVLLLVASVVVGITAPLISLWLGFLGPVAIAGAVFGFILVRRARQDSAHRGPLSVVLAGSRVTAQWAGEPPHVVDQPLLSGQSFDDHLQLVAGTVEPMRLHQLDLPLRAEEREAAVAELRRAGILVAQRRSILRQIGKGALLALAVGGVILAVKAAVLLAIGGVLLGLKARPDIVLPILAGLVILGVILKIAELVRERRRT